MRNIIKTAAYIILGLILIFVFLIKYSIIRPEYEIPAQRQIDTAFKTYRVENNEPDAVTYISHYINTAGDNFYPKEFGFEIYVQNGNNGFKQAIDSCKETTVTDPDLGYATGCDNKTYISRLENNKIVLYRITKTNKEVVTSISVSKNTKTIQYINAYELYSNTKTKTLAILQDL